MNESWDNPSKSSPLDDLLRAYGMMADQEGFTTFYVVDGFDVVPLILPNQEGVYVITDAQEPAHGMDTGSLDTPPRL